MGFSRVSRRQATLMAGVAFLFWPALVVARSMAQTDEVGWDQLAGKANSAKAGF